MIKFSYCRVILCSALFIFTAAGSLFCTEVAKKDVAVMSLKDTIKIAFQNNKDIQIKEEELKVARANIMGATSEFLPHLNADYGYTYNGFVPNFGTLGSAAKKNIGVFTGYQNNNRADIGVSQMIYNGGANVANYKQTKLELKTAEETLRARKLDAAFEAKRLFFGLLLAYETLRIAQELVDQSEEHYKDVESKYEQGTASKFEALQAKVQVSKTIPELVKAKNAISLIKADLTKLLAFDINDPIELKGKLKYNLVDINESEFIKEAYAHRPEMILRLLGVDIEKWGIAYAKSGNLPQVNANFGYVYQSNSVATMFEYKNTNWSAGVSVSWALFDGMATKAKVDAAKTKYGQAILSKENVAEQTAVDVRRACLDLVQAHTIVLTQKDVIVEAKEALMISNVAFDNGVATNLDVFDSQVSLAQVEQNLSQAIYDYIMAHAQLDRVMGKEFSEEEYDGKED